jgi:hypothetical protein
MSKIGNPLKEIIYDYIPGKSKESEKMEESLLKMEESLLKKEKDQKGYKMMSSLLLDEDLEEKGDLPVFCHLTSSPTIKLTKGNKQAKQTANNSLAIIT